MDQLGAIEWTLSVISFLLAMYSIYIYFDQKSNIRYYAPKSKWVNVIALVVIMMGIMNWFLKGQNAETAVTAVVLIIFGFMMILTRNGIGESGIYNEGLHFSWKQVNKANVKVHHDKVYICYERRKQKNEIELMNAKEEDVLDYLKKIRKIYHFGK